MSLTTTIKLFSFLIDPTFWSRIGFLISYLATSFLVLEVLRLIYSDANKREVEKFLASYSKQRPVSPRRNARNPSTERISVPIADLEIVRQRPVTPPQPTTRPRTNRRVDSGVGPETEKTFSEDRRRRRTSPSPSSTSISPPHAHAHAPLHQTSPPPAKKLRKRSDTLGSASSGEARRPVRRHREASPASEASSRHGSPARKMSREERERKGLGLGVGRMTRAKV